MIKTPQFWQESCNNVIKPTIITIEVLKIFSVCLCKIIAHYDVKNDQSIDLNSQISCLDTFCNSVKRTVYSEDIQKAFEAKLKYMDSSSSTVHSFVLASTRFLIKFAPFRFLLNLGLDILHIFYMLMQLNDSNGLSAHIFGVIISVSVVKTVLKCVFIIKHEHIKSELATALLFGPTTTFLEFVYFDRQIEVSDLNLPVHYIGMSGTNFVKFIESLLPSPIKFGFLISVLDFVMSLVDVVINDTLLRTENHVMEPSEWFTPHESDDEKNNQPIVSTQPLPNESKPLNSAIVNPKKSVRTLFNFCDSQRPDEQITIGPNDDIRHRERGSSRKEIRKIYRNATAKEQVDSTYLMYFTSVPLLLEFTRITYFSKLIMMDDILGQFEPVSPDETKTVNCNETLSSTKTFGLFDTYLEHPLYQHPFSVLNFTHTSDQGRSLPCQNFSSCLLFHIENKGLTSDNESDISSKFVYDMFLYDPIRVLFCWVLLSIHYLPLITMSLQLLTHQCWLKTFGRCFEKESASHSPRIIITKSNNPLARQLMSESKVEKDCCNVEDLDNKLKRADSFVWLLLDLHLTNYFAYAMSLLFLLFIMIGDIQYHDCTQLYKRIFGPSIPINGLFFFLVSNLSFLFLISNALLVSGPLKSIPNDLFKLLKKGFLNGFKYPWISLGRLITVIMMAINCYLLFFWLFELIPSTFSEEYETVVIYRGFTREFVLMLFCLMWSITAVLICLVHKEKLKLVLEKMENIFSGTVFTDLFGDVAYVVMIISVVGFAVFLFLVFLFLVSDIKK